MKYNVLIIACFSIILSIILLIRWYYSPTQIFQRKFEITLPKTTTIVNHKYNFWEDRLFIKVLLDKSDYEYMDEVFENRFKYLSKNDPNNYISNYNHMYSWWDINEVEIIKSYCYLTSGTNRSVYKAKTKVVDIVITLENGEYFLYVGN